MSVAPGPGFESALALFRQGDFPGTLAATETLIERDGAVPMLMFLRGLVLERLGREDEARSAYRRAADGAPPMAAAWINLGRLEDRRGNTRLAAECYDRALMAEPGNALAMSNLAELFHRNGDLLTARALLEAAVEADPNLPDASLNLGRVDLAEHRLEAAATRFAAATGAADPAVSRFADAWLLSVLCDPRPDARTVSALHREWGRRYLARTGETEDRRCRPGPDLNRPLRVGFLSADFNAHPASRFLEPVFEHHDRSQVQLIAYHTLSDEDDVTLRLRRFAEGWRAVAAWNTERLVRQIETDRIDILIDLSGHTRGARFDVLALKPAPLLGEWLGYLHASGLPTIDFRIADPLMDFDAPDAANALFLDGGIWCYAPYVESPAIADEDFGGGATVRNDRPLRFGSFNNPMKINDAVLACWARLLAAEPGSTLTLAGFNHPEGRAFVAAKLEDQGIAASRLAFLPKQPVGNYLAEVSRADVALDPFPYGGGTTTFDCLWMGTPVVTLAGHRTCGRGSAAILGRLGLDELVAPNLDAYVATASRVARQPAKVTGGRHSLRTRLASSTMTDGPAFCRAFEKALRFRWLQP